MLKALMSAFTGRPIVTPILDIVMELLPEEPISTAGSSVVRIAGLFETSLSYCRGQGRSMLPARSQTAAARRKLTKAAEACEAGTGESGSTEFGKLGGTRTGVVSGTETEMPGFRGFGTLDSCGGGTTAVSLVVCLITEGR